MHELVVTLFLADVRLLAKLMQVVSGGKEVTLPSGVAYTDLKIGGGSPVQKGYLVILDFKYTYCNPVQPVMPSWLSSALSKAGFDQSYFITKSSAATCFALAFHSS